LHGGAATKHTNLATTTLAAAISHRIARFGLPEGMKG